MRKIYFDSDYKCHIANDGTMTAVETDFFDGKCGTYIEGFRFVPSDKSWTREDGKVFHGEMVTPWKPYKELDDAQRKYEKQLLEQYRVEISELDAALLEIQYQNLIGGL